MILSAVERLERDGIIVFSNNFRRFKLDEQALETLEIDDVTKQTIPRDFARGGFIHRCWVITRRNAERRRHETGRTAARRTPAAGGGRGRRPPTPLAGS
jgi:hypothetical protein